MKQSRFTETQIIGILNEADSGIAVNEIWRKHGISSATYYKWKSKYGGLDVSELVRVKELEAENSQLKRMYANLALENEAIKAVLKNCNAVRTPGYSFVFGEGPRTDYQTVTAN
jgi:putative transposase